MTLLIESSTVKVCCSGRPIQPWLCLVVFVFGISLAHDALAASKKAVAKYQKEILKARSLEGQVQVADLHVVDCLLPGKVRRLARTTYLGPRRPVKTTASDCRIKGGEYTDYDRADYRSALKVWLTAAEKGDAEAQVNVGEIFERGLGDEPNYEAAAVWYRRSAEQGNTRGQFALGTLYEQGSGVPKSQLEALNWYRKAWGIEEDDVIFRSAARREREELRLLLRKDIETKNKQLEVLRNEVRELRKSLDTSNQEHDAAAIKAQTLQTIITELENNQSSQAQKLTALQAQIQASQSVVSSDLQFREPGDSPIDKSQQRDKNRLANHEIDLGGYYALLIGNADYDQMDDLQTPLNDIVRARDILTKKYGFTVFSLNNGTSVQIMQAINNLSEVLSPEDNLLLFFAGHGSRLNSGPSEVGYWLPKNAEQPPKNTFWVSNEFVSGHLARIPARRILVVADSCYAGLLAGEPSLSLMGVDSPDYTNPEFMKFKLSKRARLLLSSGGDRPVLDQGKNNHSVFANAFLDALKNNEELLASPQLFLRIRERVKKSSAAIGFEQNPALKSIKSAGHEVGDFFFLPQ